MQLWETRKPGSGKLKCCFGRREARFRKSGEPGFGTNHILDSGHRSNLDLGNSRRLQTRELSLPSFRFVSGMFGASVAENFPHRFFSISVSRNWCRIAVKAALYAFRKVQQKCVSYRTGTKKLTEGQKTEKASYVAKNSAKSSRSTSTPFLYKC